MSGPRAAGADRGPLPDNDDPAGWADYEHAGEIDHQRAVLAAELTAAIGHLTRARLALKELTGPLFDVELAEGDAGTDIAEFVAVAARQVRAAAAVTARTAGEHTPVTWCPPLGPHAAPATASGPGAAGAPAAEGGL